jgi:ArsR family transcriptional regulator
MKNSDHFIGSYLFVSAFPQPWQTLLPVIDVAKRFGNRLLIFLTCLFANQCPQFCWQTWSKIIVGKIKILKDILTKPDLMHTIYHIKYFRYEVKIMETIYEDNAKVFKAFCDEKRLRILELLRGGEKCACVLVDQLDMAQSSLSYHMKILCESGIVDSRQDGKWTHYKISEKGSSFALELIKTLTTQNTTTETNDCC